MKSVIDWAAVYALSDEIRLTSRRKGSGILAGAQLSRLVGGGLHFKDFRRYEPGDDIRHISWTVTARTNQVTLKTFEEDRELPTWIWIDASGSSSIGSPKPTRVFAYAEIAALLGLGALQTGNPVGIAAFSKETLLSSRPKREFGALHTACSQIAELKAHGVLQLKAMLAYARGALKRMGRIFLVSDFCVEELGRSLSILGRRHELIAVHCSSRWERGELPGGLIEVYDPELERFRVLDGKSTEIRKVLADRHQKTTRLLGALRNQGLLSYWPLDMDRSYLGQLVECSRRTLPSGLF